MAKRKRGSKAQKRGKLPKGKRKASRAKTVARAKPKRTLVKKVSRRVKQPVAPVVETVAVEVIEQPAAVTEIEEIRKAS